MNDSEIAKKLLDQVKLSIKTEKFPGHKLLWAFMNTKAWENARVLGPEGAIIDEICMRIWPDYLEKDGVFRKYWGWKHPDGDIRYFDEEGNLL